MHLYPEDISIMRTIAYFDMFDYPITREEILLFLGEKTDAACLTSQLSMLEKSRSIYRIGHLYSLRNDPLLAQKRLEGNRKAGELIKVAYKIGGLLARFPYVRGVAVSGSLSKLYADDRSDIDLFIITAPGRLWMARSMLHLLKKLSFLVGRHSWFCMNYFISENSLQIREKNIYTAIEIATLLPLRGKKIFQHFHRQNVWSKNYLPNHPFPAGGAPELQKGFLKTLIERLFNNRAGNGLEKWLMHITSKRWKKKTEKQRRNNNGFIMGMDAGPHYAKPDPRFFQEELLRKYEKACGEFRITSSALRIEGRLDKFVIRNS